MNRTVALVMGFATGVAGCGGKQPSDRLEHVKLMPGTGIGDCVDPTPASTTAWADEIDAHGRVAFCRDAEDECRTVELATGKMAPLFVAHDVAPTEQPGASIHEDGVLGVCWGPIKCLTRPPGAYERWVDVKLEGRSRAAALAVTEADRRKVYVLDERLDTVRSFEVAAGAGELVWKDGRFLLLVSDGDSVRGHLYGADGTARGTVGAIDGASPIDLGERSWPVAVGPTTWAFLAEDARTLAVHDLDTGRGVRIDLGVTDQPAARASLAGKDGTVAVVLGGTRYGDVLVVDVATGAVKPVPATRCPGEDAQ